MARIRVERRRGGSGWVWLFVVLGLVVLGIFLFFEFGEDLGEGAGEEIAENMEDTSRVVRGPQGGRITSFSTLTAMRDPETLVGRRVELDSVRVARVVNDSTLFVSHLADTSSAMSTTDITPADRTPADRMPSETVPYDTSAGRWVLVVLTDSERAGTRDAVQRGQTISLSGRVERLQTRQLSRLGIAPPDSERVADQHIYVRAQRRERSQL